MSDNRLAEIRARWADVHWRACGCGKCGAIYPVSDNDDWIIADTNTSSADEGITVLLEVFVPNAEKIAAAPDDIRYLLAEVERLEAENARLLDYYAVNETILPDGELGVDVAALVRDGERMREALREIANKHDGKSSHGWDDGFAEGCNHCAEIAADALEADPDGD